MKKLIKFQTLLLLISFAICTLSSCTKEDTSKINITENEIPEGFEYAKTVKLEDIEGNIAIVQIAGNDESRVKNFTENDLVFKVSNEKSKLANAIEFNILEDGDLTQEGADDVTFVDFPDDSNTIFINIIGRKLNQDVVRFSVMPKSINSNSGGASKTKTYYAYGVLDQVRGAEVEYYSEDRKSCYIDIDLDKKDGDGQNGWNGLWDERMGVPGTHRIFSHHIYYYQLRLRVNSQGWRCSDDDKVSFGAWFYP